MKKIGCKDRSKRKIVSTLEKNKIILKSIIKNTNLNNTIRCNAVTDTTMLQKNSSIVRTVNFCLLTKRKKKINKLYRFSRLIFLKMARYGSIVGLTKKT